MNRNSFCFKDMEQNEGVGLLVKREEREKTLKKRGELRNCNPKLVGTIKKKKNRTLGVTILDIWILAE